MLSRHLFNTFGAGNYLFSGPFDRIKGLQYRNYSLKYKGVEYKQIHIHKHIQLFTYYIQQVVWEYKWLRANCSLIMHKISFWSNYSSFYSVKIRKVVFRVTAGFKCVKQLSGCEKKFSKKHKHFRVQNISFSKCNSASRGKPENIGHVTKLFEWNLGQNCFYMLDSPPLKIKWLSTDYSVKYNNFIWNKNEVNQMFDAQIFGIFNLSDLCQFQYWELHDHAVCDSHMLVEMGFLNIIFEQSVTICVQEMLHFIAWNSNWWSKSSQ